MTDLDDVVDAVHEVKHSIESKTSTAATVFYVIIAMAVGSLVGSALDSRARFAMQYQLSLDKVTTQNEPHDCNFLAAPLGLKYCHYERTTQKTYWATSTTNNPIVSYDEGKSWSTFTPDQGVTVPQYKTLESVNIAWEKKDD